LFYHVWDQRRKSYHYDWKGEFNTNRRERIKGALIGVAVGDAMGMPSEMYTRKAIRETFGRITGFLPSRPDSPTPRKMNAYEVTDDTAHSVLVIEMLQRTGGKVDPTIYLALLQQWMNTFPKSLSVVGPSTMKAINAINLGVPMEKAGVTGTTNGAAMKAAPIGLLPSYGGIAEIAENIRLLSLPTHNTGTAIGAAAAVAACVYYVSCGGTDWETYWAYALEAAQIGMSMGYDLPGPSVAARINLAKKLVAEAKDIEDACESLYNIVGTGLSSTESVPSALALAYISNGDPMFCATLCANMGGDTDTMGAMACAICGAMQGSESFAKETVDKIMRVNNLDFDVLADQIMTFGK